MGRILFFLIGILIVIYFGSTMLLGNSISEGDIEDLFEQRVALHNKLVEEQRPLINFVARHMDPDFKYLSTNTTHIPGEEPQDLYAQMDKQEYGAYLFNTMGAMARYSYSNEIKSIEIDEETGRSARVTYTMTTDAAGAGQPGTRINAECQAGMRLNVSGILVFQDIACKGDMHITPNTAQPPAPPAPE